MKTIALLAILLLPACTADVFATSDDAGPVSTTDAGTDTDATPDTDATQDTDAAPSVDGGTDAADSMATEDADAAPVKDAAADSNAADADAGPEPLCGPLGYKLCQSGQFSKCQVTAGDGTATCVVPGSTQHLSGCVKDGDCRNDEICDVSLCRNLCQKNAVTPWGTNSTTWGTKTCTLCPFNAGSYQLSRLPSWLGVCID